MIIDGKKIARGIIQELKEKPRPKKFLAAFLVGGDPASISFLKQKEKVAEELNVDFRLYKFPAEITQDELRKEILKIVSHQTCGGAIIQLPLPEHISRQYVLNVIPREKDVDVLGERSLGAFYVGRNPVLPPAVGVLESILRIVNQELRITNTVVIGTGSLIGKPISLWLEDKVAELTIFNEHTADLNKKLKEADLIISGVGKANLFSAEDIKENALVIDFGYDMASGKISGDFNPVIPARHASQGETGGHDSSFMIHYTPTPGGTGPILVAKLFENFYKLNNL